MKCTMGSDSYAVRSEYSDPMEGNFAYMKTAFLSFLLIKRFN